MSFDTDSNTHVDAEKLMYEQREADYYKKISLELATKKTKAEDSYSARADNLNVWRHSTGADLHLDESAAISFVSTEVYASFCELALTQVQEYEARGYLVEEVYDCESDIPQKRGRRRMKSEWLRRKNAPIAEPLSSVLLRRSAKDAYLKFSAEGKRSLQNAPRRLVRLVALGKRIPLFDKPGNLSKAA